MEGCLPRRRRWSRLDFARRECKRSSVYVLIRVYAPEELGTVALVANDDWLRLWCNGELKLRSHSHTLRSFPCHYDSAPAGTRFSPR